MTKIHGSVGRIICRREDWASFLVIDKKGSYKCVGSVCNLREGMDVDISAEETIHPKYGTQYKVKSFKERMPSDMNGIQTFLSSGIIKGVGPATAKKIVDRFKENTLMIIKTNPERLVEVPSISEKKAKAIVEGYAGYKQYEDIFELADGAITLNEISKIIEEYKERAISVLKTNPYQICEDIDGFGFLKADRIAKACGIKEDSEVRIKAAIKFALEQMGQMNGHCFLSSENLTKETMKVLNRLPESLAKIKGLENKAYAAIDTWERDRQLLIDRYKLESGLIADLDAWKNRTDKYIDLIADSIIEQHASGEIFVDEKDGILYIAVAKLYYAEKDIADSVCRMLKKPSLCDDREEIEDFIEKYEKKTGFKAAPEQRQAVITSLLNRVSIITGGPGRGKTTIIKLIIEYWKTHVGRDIMLLAPTGRASQRIRESVCDTSVDISTIHKMIGFGKGKPKREATPNTLILCDECSMVDVLLASKLLIYGENATFIFVGDVDQLPAVGPGNFFKDMIQSRKVPVTTLITCYRNAGLIAENSDKVNRKNTKLHTGDDFIINYMDREKMAATICEHYMNLIRSGHPAKDICILTLQRVRGCASVAVLNKMIQELYNPLPEKDEYDDLPFQSPDWEWGEDTKKDDTPGEIRLMDRVFRLKDRVMQTKNNYHMEIIMPNGALESGVFNGDVGTITNVNQNDEILTVTFDDGRVAHYGKLEMKDLVLAYAMTVHKAQGSEYPYVIFTTAMDQFTLLNKSIVYTAISRAKTCVICDVERQAFNMAIGQDDLSVRNTRLCSFLRQNES